MKVLMSRIKIQLRIELEEVAGKSKFLLKQRLLAA
jgi:hypothetical protein